MNGLSPKARALLKAAHHAHDPTAWDRLRVRTGLIIKLSAMAHAASVASSAGAAPTHNACGSRRMP